MKQSFWEWCKKQERIGEEEHVNNTQSYWRWMIQEMIDLFFHGLRDAFKWGLMLAFLFFLSGYVFKSLVSDSMADGSLPALCRQILK